MRPTVVSATTQTFLGIRYYLCGPYFQRHGVRLHRVVWVHHRGAIPLGWHVHHRDGDRANNAIGNLECLSAAEHGSARHGAASGERLRPFHAKGIAAAALWHGSPAGLAWHSQHARKYRDAIRGPVVAKQCDHCGTGYTTFASRAKWSRFCGPNCKARALRLRRRIAAG